MSESTLPVPERRGTPHASLAALGVKLGQLDLFRAIREQVHIPQKTVKYTPVEKLYEAFVGCLAGAKGIVEVEHCLRADRALQAAFGCRGCAEQSVIQDTLNACEDATVTQMHEAMQEIYRQHSAGYRHDYQAGWQLLDVDMSGMPCGRKAALATKGYFAKQRNRRGRQLGRVLATRYEEVVVDRLFDGKTQLSTALQPLVEAAEEVLSLREAPERRRRTILRVDAGGGTLAQVNWLLERGYQFHGKDYSSQRAAKLAASVTTWYPDPKQPGREVGWVALSAEEYARPVWRVAVRCRKANGGWRVAVLISTLAPEAVLELVGDRVESASDPAAGALAYAYFYDLRGGGVETSIKGDKQGLGMTRRNKKRFPAQQVLVQLNALAHNVLVWSRSWLAPTASAVGALGIMRLVRDVFGIAGVLELAPEGRIQRIILNEADRWAHRLVTALQALVGPDTVAINLGQT
jgi:hypothetical protein